ncbi:hypothetical protein BmIO_00403 [Borrelia miyamotoi]|nr:hypothetical protein BmIO_00403 [Borrelia miyamotoi]
MSKNRSNNEYIKSIAFIANLFESNEFKNILKVLNSPDKIYSYVKNLEKNSADNVISVSKPRKIVYVCVFFGGSLHIHILLLRSLKLNLRGKGTAFKLRLTGFYWY